MRLFGNSLIRKRRRKITKNNGKSFHGLKDRVSLRFLTSKLFIRGILLILLIFLVALITFLVSIYRKLDSDNVTTWKGDENINVALIGIDEKPDGYRFIDAVVILSLDVRKDKLGIISIDPDAVTEVSGVKTTIKRSYNIENDGERGYENTIQGVENFLSIDIQKYIAFSQDDYLAIQAVIGDLSISLDRDLLDKDYEVNGQHLNLEAGTKTLGNIELLGIISADANGKDQRLKYQNQVLQKNIAKLFMPSMYYKLFKNVDDLTRFETNLSRSELIKVGLFFRSSRQNIVTSFTRSDSFIELENNEMKPIYERIDKDVQPVFLNSDIVREQARIEVLNATDQSGLATKYARRLSAVGFRVVRSGNAVNNQEKTRIYISNNNDLTNTRKELMRQFENAEIVEEKYKYRHIGEIVVVIGEDNK